jgi:hypothetical protein
MTERQKRFVIIQLIVSTLFATSTTNILVIHICSYIFVIVTSTNFTPKFLLEQTYYKYTLQTDNIQRICKYETHLTKINFPLNVLFILLVHFVITRMTSELH